MRTKLSLLAVAPGILAVLAPKCPMCLIAYLSVFGITVGMTGFAMSVLGPLVVVLAWLALGFALRRAKVRSLGES